MTQKNKTNRTYLLLHLIFVFLKKKISHHHHLLDQTHSHHYQNEKTKKKNEIVTFHNWESSLIQKIYDLLVIECENTISFMAWARKDVPAEPSGKLKETKPHFFLAKASQQRIAPSSLTDLRVNTLFPQNEHKWFHLTVYLRACHNLHPILSSSYVLLL